MISDPHRAQPVREKGRPLKDAAGAVILVHGRGASASDMLGLAEELYHPALAYLAPEAAGHVWYPKSFLAPREENEPWLSSALKKLEDTVEHAISSGIPRRKIVLAGFSQGACLATEFVASHPARYGGLVAFTGGLIGPPGMKFTYTGDLEGMPAFLGSGDPDPHVPWQRVQESAGVLSRMGAEVRLNRYPGMPHTVSQEEIDLAKPIIMALAG
jgi:phospholipase/carboxylesterase